ncbi:MAG TPA: tetratricopeptide repeat protein [Kofleriaceae bacterium]|nr:tetratricopeptide repeat protein [Kofleriaceae bacterium]
MVTRFQVLRSPLAALVIVAAAGLGSSSIARAGKRTHEASAGPEVHLSERAKPPPRRADAPAPPSADQLLSVEALLGELHLEQIDLLRGLIARTPDDAGDEKADYYVRLAELHARAHRLHRLKGTEDEIALGKETDPARRAKLAASAAAHQAAARVSVVSVIETYRAVIANPRFSSYRHLDDAVYYYAYTLEHAGHPEEARAAYEQLLRSYPGSRRVPDAYLALADAAFEAGQLADAETRYRKVLLFPGSSMYRYAQYKLGWVLLGQRKHQDALELFYQVALGTREPERQVLHRAARHDFVRAYAEVGRADRALVAFQRVEPGQPYAMLADLGDLYLDQGKFDRAISVFRALIAARPDDLRVCAWQHAIARATLAIGAPGDKVREIEALVQLHTALARRPAARALPASEAADCRAAAEEMSGQIARAYHQEAVKTQNAELFGLADRLYRAYLGAFAGAPELAETEYFHAELKWSAAELERNPRVATQMWEGAADAFTRVIQTGKVSAKLIRVSADAAMQARVRALAVDADPGPARPDDTAPPVPRPLPERARQLIAAYDLYLAHVPDDDDDQRIAVTFEKANLLRRHDHLAEAIPLFESIVARHPEHEAAEYAAQLVLDSDNRLGREDAMLAFARSLSPALLAAHPAVRDTVAKLQRTASRKQLERLEAEARRTGRRELYVQCGERYLEIYNQGTDAPDAEGVLYNAGVCFELSRSLGAAIRVYQTLQRLFPSGKLTARALARIGNVHATTAQYREAAAELETYAGRYPGESNAHGALSDAVAFRKGLGDDAQAIADTEQLIATLGPGRAAEAAAAHFSLIAIYEKLGDLDRLARHLRGYLERHGAAGGADRRVIAWTKLGELLWQQACPVAGADGACVRRVRAPVEPARPAPAVRKRCGDDSHDELVVVPRDDRKVRDATAALDRAIAEYEHAGKLDGDARGALYHYAHARFLRAERDYERYLAMAIPGSLDFDTRKPAIARRSHQRFDGWLAGKAELGARLRAAYEPLIKLGDAVVAIAATARIAAVSQNAAAQLYRAEIPASVRTGAFADDAALAYCEALEQVAEPLDLAARDHYQVCLDTSTRLGWFSQWSRICERELGRLLPDRYPSTLELRREPSAVACIVEPEPPPP